MIAHWESRLKLLFFQEGEGGGLGGEGIRVGNQEFPLECASLGSRRNNRINSTPAHKDRNVSGTLNTVITVTQKVEYIT